MDGHLIIMWIMQLDRHLDTAAPLNTPTIVNRTGYQSSNMGELTQNQRKVQINKLKLHGCQMKVLLRFDLDLCQGKI